MKHKGRVRQRRKKGRGGVYKQTKWRFFGMLGNVFARKWKEKREEVQEEIERKLVMGTFASSSEPAPGIQNFDIKVYESEFGMRKT